MKKFATPKGFTLLEVLLVVAGISILAGIVIIAVNPGKQLGDTRNAQRRADVNTIINATYQYALDVNGALPTSISSTQPCSTATNQICKTGVATSTCASSSLVDLSVLTLNEKYVVAIPTDPSVSTGDGAGYFINKSSNGRVTVCAPNAEQGATISVTR